MTRRATAQDVADLAGVSRSAVSLVLNGRGRGNISAANQAAIQEAARQLRYTPNAVALSLRRQRTRTLGVLTWRGHAGLPHVLLDAVSQAAMHSGYLLLVVEVQTRPDLVAVLQDRQVDGFVVVAPDLVEYDVPEALADVPTVLVNCTDPTLGTTSLVPDEVGAGATAASVLVQAGHTRVGVLAHRAGTLQSERRVLGVRQRLAAARLPEPYVLTSGRDVDGGFDAAHRMLSGPRPPTAVVATHERLAVGVVLAAAQLQLGVPDDVSVVSLDDGEDLAAHLRPPLTTVQRPDALIAGYGLDALVDVLRGETGPARQLSFVCPLLPGGSVGAPRC